MFVLVVVRKAGDKKAGPPAFSQLNLIQCDGMKTAELFKNKIYKIRGRNVMLDENLSALFQIENECLKEQVRQNIKRFPPDFMFKLKQKEYEALLLHDKQITNGIIHALPLAFTEMGAAMLACVLETEEAIRINIQLIRDSGCLEY